jgi:hypothetical protein
MTTQWKAHQLDWSVISQFDNSQQQYLCITQREAHILLSALGVFRWRTRWIDLPNNQSLDFVDTLASKLMCEPCCDAVLSCLENNEDVIERIREIIRSETEGVGNPDKPINELDEFCPNDVVWASVSNLVDYLDQAVVDLFEIIETATNVLEIVTEWADNVPFLGQFMASALDYITWIQDSVKDSYLANVTTDLLNTYKCELFCLYKSNNCQGLSLDHLVNYFLGKIGGDIGETVEDLVTFLITGAWVGDQIVAATMLSIVGFMRLDDGIGFITIPNGYYSLQTIMALGANNPDADWSILCDECPLQTYTIDYVASDGGATATRGSWDSGSTSQGWVTEFYRTYYEGIPVDYRERLLLTQPLPELHAESVTITFDWNDEKHASGFDQLHAVIVNAYYQGNLVATDDRFSQAVGTDKTFTLTFANEVIDEIEIQLTPMDISLTGGIGTDDDAEAILKALEIGYR